MEINKKAKEMERRSLKLQRDGLLYLVGDLNMKSLKNNIMLKKKIDKIKFIYLLFFFYIYLIIYKFFIFKINSINFKIFFIRFLYLIKFTLKNYFQY